MQTEPAVEEKGDAGRFLNCNCFKAGVLEFLLVVFKNANFVQTEKFSLKVIKPRPYIKGSPSTGECWR